MEKLLQAEFRIRLNSGETVEEFVILERSLETNTCKLFNKLISNVCDKGEISGIGDMAIRSITLVATNELGSFDFSRKDSGTNKKNKNISKGDKNA